MFDTYGIWLFHESVQKDDPVEAAQKMKEAGIDTVFMLLGNPRNRLMPQEEVEARMERLIACCHEVGISVQGCFDELHYFADPRDNELDAAYVQTWSDGTKGGLLCPANPKVVDWAVGRLQYFLNRFDLDGISLEDSYIFQSSAEYDAANLKGNAPAAIETCYCDYCRNHAPHDSEQRRDFKIKALTNMVARLSHVCKSQDKPLPFSTAARLPYGRDFYVPYRQEVPYFDDWANWQAKDNLCADWVGWHQQGLVDFICTMSYFNNTRMVELETLEAKSRIKDPEQNVWPGLGLFTINAEYHNSGEDPALINDGRKIREQLELLQRMGQRNVMFFMYHRNPEWSCFNDDHIKAMAEMKK